MFACRLVEKAFRMGHHVYLHVASEQEARELDDLLWGFKPDSFIPHNLVNDSASHELPPVQIGFGENPGEHNEVLVNLSLTVPNFFSRFDRVFEIVTSDETVTMATRKSYKFYRDRGYTIENHDMRPK